jgi:hypothetical protein
MKIVKCKNCRHIYDENNGHTCISDEYTKLRDELVSEAAKAVVSETDEHE